MHGRNAVTVILLVTLRLTPQILDLLFFKQKTAYEMVVIASDSMYLYENLSRHVPIAQTLGSASNLRAQERMVTLASDSRLIVPGHDPEVFVRFPTPGNGVARIR